MRVAELLVYIAIGIMVGALILLIGNYLMVNIIKVQVSVNP